MSNTVSFVQDIYSVESFTRLVVVIIHYKTKKNVQQNLQDEHGSHAANTSHSILVHVYMTITWKNRLALIAEPYSKKKN